MIITYVFGGSFLSITERRHLLHLIIILVILAIIISPSISSATRKSKEENNIEPEVLDAERDPMDFHNDFTKVGCSSDYQDSVTPKEIKPIDYSGNAIEAGIKEIEHDISHLNNSKK
ncbi:hypothetical protein [Bacteriovorax sp. Seq25_V]|uniref:hypothetical protein n=1 Tax=Bacteriovorax sp. Seq25_V TaxID=1201288 RepID=UPI0012FB93C6|nr:hypothetical protein [Bacteriovorax sp. Seq25_V]